MHFNLRGALGIGIPVLLGGAVAIGAAALPARATTWQDTAVSGFPLQASTFGGAGLGAKNTTPTNGNPVISLSGTGVTWSLHGTVPTGVSLSSGNTIVYTGPAISATEIVADATDSAGNAEALEIPVAFTAANSIQIPTGATLVKVSVTDLALTNVSNTVKFSATSSPEGNGISFAESNLPTGLVSGDPVLTFVGGTAAPGSYPGVKVAATDADGAALTGTFRLVVQANAVSGLGDEVNRFGNGFDSFRQHQFPGAIIAGWPATQSDPATHFLLHAGTHQGAVQFEYAPRGTGTGLCVSDPGGGWSSDPLRDGLILTPCNTGPFQQFVPQSDGTLQNVATGLFVNPNGTGAQLRGGSSPTPWGGSNYAWTDFNNLPG